MTEESRMFVEKGMTLSYGIGATCSGRALVCPTNLPLSVSPGKETRQNPVRAGPRIYYMTQVDLNGTSDEQG